MATCATPGSSSCFRALDESARFIPNPLVFYQTDSMSRQDNDQNRTGSSPELVTADADESNADIPEIIGEFYIEKGFHRRDVDGRNQGDGAEGVRYTL